MKPVFLVLIGLIIIVPAIHALPYNNTYAPVNDDLRLVLEIKTPQENEILSLDVVPPFVWVSGEVKSTAALRSIIVSSTMGLTDCGNQSGFGCNVPVGKGSNQIIVTVTDSDGKKTSAQRLFTVRSGGPSPPPRITIYGTITTPEGKSISGATVRLESESYPITVQSEADGSYRINNANGYHQRIVVEKTGYTNVTREITFDQNVNSVDFTLQPATKPAPGFTPGLCLVALLGSLLILASRKELRR